MDKSIPDTNVKVFTRVRPLQHREKLNGDESCIKVNKEMKQVIIGRNRLFGFDGAFDPQSTQEQLYFTAVDGMIKNIFDGYNSTIFAYGQTGSGKTYTMGTSNQEELLDEEKGILPRAVEQIFKYIEEYKHNRKISLTASFIEVYKEEVRDLLSPTEHATLSGTTTPVNNEGSNPIQIREDEHGNTILSGVYEHSCDKEADILECLEVGSNNRVTGATQMNELSSRSHCVFTINIIQELNTEIEEDLKDFIFDNDIKNVIAGKFHFVDLAGSERAHKTGNVGDRFKESIYINSGLLALGNVISALGDPKKKKGVHIPYRESKITRILKDSLGGNARTIMICCISPAVSDYDETINALKYANRARNIRNKPVINRDKTKKQIALMQNEILELRQQLSRQKSENNNNRSQYDPGSNPMLGDSLTKQEMSSVDNKVHLLNLQSIFLKSMEIMYYLANDYQNHGSAWYKNYDLVLKIENFIEQIKNINRESFDEELMKNFTRSFPVDIYSLEEIMTSKIERIKADLANDTSSNGFPEDDRTIEELRADNERYQNEIYETRLKFRDYETKLVERQREINQYRREIRRLNQQILDNNKNNNNNNNTNNNHANTNGNWQYNFSATPQMSPNYETNDDDPNLTVDTKRVKSNPPMTEFSKGRNSSLKLENSRKLQSTSSMLYHNPDMLVSRFHAQSHFLLSEIENSDDVIRPFFNDSTADNLNPDENPEIELNDQQNPRILSSKMTGLDLCEPSEFVFPLDEEMSHNSNDALKKHLKLSQLKLTDANQKLRDLSINIRLKEQLIKDLIRNSKGSNKVNEDYEERIKLLETEKNETEMNVVRLRNELMELSNKQKDSTQSKKIKENFLYGQYEKKLELSQKKLTELQKKQAESQKVTQVTSNYDKKVSELMVTIERLKQDRIHLQQKLKIESDIKIKLEKDFSKDQEKIKNLQIQTKTQQIVLKRKQEELISANRKLRRGSSSMEVDLNQKAEEQRKWMDEEIEKIIFHKKQIEDLKIDLKNREDILQKREQLLIERSHLGSNEQNDQTLPETNTTGSKEKLAVQSTQTEAKTEEEWICELDEAIEALNEAVEYKNMSIETKKDAVRDTKVNILMSKEDVINKLVQIEPNESRQLLLKYLEKVVDLKEELRKYKLNDNEKDLEIEELQSTKDQLERVLERQNIEFDRRYTQLQTDMESEKHLLLSQIGNKEADDKHDNQELPSKPSTESKDFEKEYNMLKEKFSKVEKESLLYKKTCRDMKNKIKDWMQTGRLKADTGVLELANTKVNEAVKSSRPLTAPHHPSDNKDNSNSQSKESGNSNVKNINSQTSAQFKQVKRYDPDHYSAGDSNNGSQIKVGISQKHNNAIVSRIPSSRQRSAMSFSFQKSQKTSGNMIEDNEQATPRDSNTASIQDLY